ncbi:MAG: UDP-N-acetylmuramoyl-tripeptide--D-alanyl-D-alanine ligase [Planctomycetes bacterium]|nr:UDP-N-acetylmuramoyl-tripeptide--D-alanyl-D-alanine ligase [Planctomycetota bacterium]
MIRFMLSEVVAAVEGRIRADLPAGSASGVSTDSRTLRGGEVFFAVRGENFDGHDFVLDALKRGACAAVVAAKQAADLHRAHLAAGGAGLLIEVEDPVIALGRLAAFHRSQAAAEVIAIVGSNGKTTTKALIDHVLSAKLRGRASPKSFNNNIGVPHTLLSVEAADDYVVVEIGTNAPGEIAHLARLVQPDMVVLTSIGEEHLEGLKDLTGVAREECSVFETLAEGAFVAFPADAPHVRERLPQRPTTLVSFGAGRDANLRVGAVRYESDGLHFRINDRFDYVLPMPGAHNAQNAAGAIAVALRLGFDHRAIADRLRSFQPPPMRMETRSLGGITIINDAYNANPASMRAAIEMLEEYPCAGRRIVAVGEMRELGARSAAEHEALGRRLARGRLDCVLLVGPTVEWLAAQFSGRTTAEPVESVDECGRRLAALARPGDVVLLKASRAVGLERAAAVFERARAAADC